MNIKQAAEQSGVSARNIRYYAAARRGRGVHPLKAAVHIQLRRRSVADGSVML